MTEQQRNGVRGVRGLVEVVDVEGGEAIDLDILVVVGQGIELGFLCSPVEAGLPVLCQPLHVGEGCTVIEAGTFELTRESPSITF